MFRSILFSSWNNLKTFGNYSKVLFQSSKEKLQAFEMIPTLKTIIYGGLHLCKQAIGKIKHLNTVFIQQRLPVRCPFGSFDFRTCMNKSCYYIMFAAGFPPILESEKHRHRFWTGICIRSFLFTIHDIY